MTLLASTVVGSILKLWGAKTDNQKMLNQHMLSVMEKQQKGRKEAREYENKHYQWTRRTIAISVTLAVIVLPKVAVILKPDLPVVFGWTALNPGFLFFPDEQITTWESMKGLVITPLDTHIVSAITGLYFGGSLAGHNR